MKGIELGCTDLPGSELTGSLSKPWEAPGTTAIRWGPRSQARGGRTPVVICRLTPSSGLIAPAEIGNFLNRLGDLRDNAALPVLWVDDAILQRGRRHGCLQFDQTAGSNQESEAFLRQQRQAHSRDRKPDLSRYAVEFDRRVCDPAQIPHPRTEHPDGAGLRTVRNESELRQLRSGIGMAPFA